MKRVKFNEMVLVPLKQLPITPLLELTLEKARPLIESDENGMRSAALAIVNLMATLTLSAFFVNDVGTI